MITIFVFAFIGMLFTLSLFSLGMIYSYNLFKTDISKGSHLYK